MTANVLTQILILLTFSVSIQCQFEFKDLKVVHDVVIATIQLTQSNCIAVLRPTDENHQQKSAIDRLTRQFARDQSSKYGNRRASVMSYTIDTYEKDYLDPYRQQRDTCFYGVTLVMVSESTNAQLKKISENTHTFERQGWVLFANRSELTGLLRNVPIRNNSRFYVVEQVGRGAIFNISEIGMFDEGLGSVAYILWSKHLGVIGGSKKLHAKIKGVTLKVGTLEHPPYIYLHRNDNDEIISVTGFYGDLWNILLEALLIKSVFIEHEDGYFGFCYENNTCTGVIGMLAEEQVDVALSQMTMSQERSQIFDFLLPIIKTKYKIFYKKNAEIFDELKIFRPLEYPVWIAVVIWIILGGIAVKIITTAEKSFQNPRRHFSFISCVYFILRTLCNQGVDQTPKLCSQRIFFITAYLTATLIVTSYSASLISVLTVKTPVEPFKELSDILETDYQLTIHSDSVDFDFFAKTTDKIHKKIYEKSVIKTETFFDYKDAIYTVCNTPKTAFFGTISEVAATNRECVVLPLTSEISPAYQTIAVAKHFQYRNYLNYGLLRMFEFGLVDRYRKLYIPYTYDTSVEKEIGISLTDVGALFIYLFALQLLSVGTCILEILWWQHHHEKLKASYRISNRREHFQQ